MHKSPPRDKTPPRDPKREKLYGDIIAMLTETNNLIKEVKVNKKYCYRLDSKIVGIHQTVSSFKVGEDGIHSATYNRLIRLLLDIQEFLKMSSVKQKTILGTFNKSKIQSTFDSLNQRLLDIMIEEPRLLPRDDTVSINTAVVGGDDFSHNSRKKRSKAPLNLLSINSSMSHDAYDYDDGAPNASTLLRGKSGSIGGIHPQNSEGADIQHGEVIGESNSLSNSLYSLRTHMSSTYPSNQAPNISSESEACTGRDSESQLTLLQTAALTSEQTVLTPENILSMMKQADDQRNEALAISCFDNICMLFQFKGRSEEDEDSLSVITSNTSLTNHASALPSSTTTQSDLFSKYRDHQNILGEGGACKLLASTFSSLEWSVQVCESALRAICFLTRFSPHRSSSNADNISILGERGVCTHIVSSMSTYARNELLLFWGCKAICNLTTDCLPNNIKFGEAGVCPVIVSLLKSYGGGSKREASDSSASSGNVSLDNDDIDFSFEFSQQIWTCLINLSLCQENNLLLFDCGATEAVLSVWKNSLSQHNSTSNTSNRDIIIAKHVTLWGCMAIQNFALNDKHKSQLGILKPNVCKLVVGALTRYIEDLEIAVQGFMVVQNVANNNDKNNALLGDAGVCEIVVRVLRHHIHEEIIAQRGCMALMNLSYNNERNRIILAKHGACEIIRKVLEIHLDREAVVEFAFGTIVNFTEDRNDLVLHKLSAAGVCEAIMPAFLMHCVDSNCESVAELGGWTIKNLAMANHENNTILGAMGACEGVTSALQSHIGHASVAEMCLWAIRALSDSSESITNSYRLGACGACEAVTSALQLHCALEAVVEQGCGAVLNLAQYSPHNRALLTAADAYNVIIKAVKEHIAGSNEDIEFIGFGALSNLMRTEESTELNVNVAAQDNDDVGNDNAAIVSEALKALWVAVERGNENVACTAIELVTKCVLRGENGANQTPLGKGHACEMLVHLVYPLLDSKVVVRAALECICRLSRYGDTKNTANEDNISTLGSCGMCKVLVLGLERHFNTDQYINSTSDIGLTVWGCKALTFLASNMANNHKLGTAGGCDLITQVLYKYVKKKSDVIVQHGWGAVINLTLWEENNLQLGDAGICECLYDYMLAWQDNVDTLVVLLIATQNLALTALNRSRLGRAGVCQLIMTAVNKNKANEAIVEYSLMAIQKLALEEHNCFVMHDMKVCAFVVKTILSVLVNEAVVELGSMAIMNISAGGNPDIVQALEQANVVECITTVLEKYILHPEIVEYSLIALNNLSSSSFNPKLYGVNGVCESISKIIKEFRQNEIILEQVCKTIVAVIRIKENLVKFQQSNIPTILSKTLVSMSRHGNKLRAMLERTKQMIKTGNITTLSSSGNQLVSMHPNHSKNNSTPNGMSPPSTSVNGGVPVRQGPLRLERSSSSSVSSVQSQSTFSSLPLDGSVGNALTSRPSQQTIQHHTMTVTEVISKIKKGIENIEETTTATCLRNIARMCEGHQATQAEFGNQGACKEVLEAMSTFLNSRVVAENGLRAVCYLSRYGQDKSTANENNNRIFGQIKLPHMLVKTMQFHEDNEKVCLYGCKAIMNLASFEANNDMLGDAGACEVVVSVLTKFSTVGIVLKQGLWAMINLALAKKNNARFTSSGCAMAVQILREHTADPDITAWACMAVQNLCINKENQSQLGSMEAVEMVVKTMEANIKDTMTIQFGLMAIEKLVQCNDNSRRAGACGACELVLRAMQMFNSNEMIIELCWKSMNRLCNQSLDNCYRFVDNNACALLASSLKKFSKTEEIVEQALAAIGYLGGTPVKMSKNESGVQYVRTLLGNSGACEAVTFILTAYTSDEAIKKASQQQSDNIGIIFLCLQAIASLSINEEENRSRFGACGACEKTIAAMTLHLGSEDIAIRGATVVLSLGKHHPSNSFKFTATGALTVMLRIIQKNSSNMNVVVMGFSAMTTVLNATCGDKDISAPQTERATVTFGANTKDDNGGEIGGHGHASLQGGPSSGRPTMRRERRTGAVGIWEDAGSYDVILKTMRVHLSNKEISACGCQLLHSMIFVCSTNVMSSAMNSSFGSGRGINLPPKTLSSIGDVVVQLLATYSTSSTRIASHACQTVTNILSDPRTGLKHSSIFGKLGLCEILLTTMNNYIDKPKHSSLLEKILISLAYMCNDPENSALCGRSGLCERMVKLIYADMDTEVIVTCACRLLAALACETSNLSVLSACKAETLVMTVLTKHKHVGATVTEACIIVGALVRSKDVLVQLESLKVYEALVAVLQCHLHHASVTQEACHAMYCLSQESDDCCLGLLAADAFSILIKVLSNHFSYYRPATSTHACRTITSLCQVKTDLAESLYNGVYRNGKNEDFCSKGKIGISLCHMLSGLDEYSPRNCHSSNANKDLHEKVPLSSALKQKQNTGLISAVLKLLSCLSTIAPITTVELFPGHGEHAPWITVTSSVKKITNSDLIHPHSLFKILVCGVLKEQINNSSIVLLVLSVMSSSFKNCPESKRYFALQEQYDTTNSDDMWLPVISEVTKVYLSTKKIYLAAIEILILFWESVNRAVIVHNPQLMASLNVDGLVNNIIEGLSTYLTDTTALLDLSKLVYHFSRVGQFSSVLKLVNDLETHCAAEKLMRVLQVHQNDDEEHNSSTLNRNALTLTQTQAVKLCINCCEALGSLCEQSEQVNVLIGSQLGFCDCLCKLIMTTLTKSKLGAESSTTGGREVYKTLLETSSTALACLIGYDENIQIALTNNILNVVISMLLSDYKNAIIASNSCRVLVPLLPRKLDEKSSTKSKSVVSPSDIKNSCNGVMLALNLHLKNESVVRNACWAFTQLATDSFSKRLLGTQGGGILLLRIMLNYHHNPDVLELVLGAIINLADHDIDSTTTLFKNNVISQIDTLFQSFCGLQRDQHYILCELLCMVSINLTEASDVPVENLQIITAFGNTNIFQSVLIMLGKVSAAPITSRNIGVSNQSNVSFADDMGKALMSQGCWLLKNVALHHARNSSNLGELGACEVLVPVINSYLQKHADIAEIACNVLVSLLTADMQACISNNVMDIKTNLVRLTDAGGFDVAIQTLFAFTGSDSTSAIRMGSILVYRFFFLTVVNTDSTAAENGRGNQADDEFIQSNLDSFATIQHVMEEALLRHASQDIDISDRAVRVLHHLYVRTFRACPFQCRSFTTIMNGPKISSESFKDRTCRRLILAMKLPRDDGELRDHHRRLILSDWLELSRGLAPLLLQYQKSVSTLTAIFDFIADLCNGAAQQEIQSSFFSSGVIQNIVMVFQNYVKIFKSSRKGVDSELYLHVVQHGSQCLVALLEGHHRNKECFLVAGGGNVLLDLLNHTQNLQAGTKSTEQQGVIPVMKEAAVILTYISRVLVVLLSDHSLANQIYDNSVATEERKPEKESTSCCQQLLEIGIYKPLLQIVFSHSSTLLPVSCQLLFQRNHNLEATIDTGDDVIIDLNADTDIEERPLFSSQFLFQTGHELEGESRRSEISLNEKGDNSTFAEQESEGVSTILACIHAMDALSLCSATTSQGRKESKLSHYFSEDESIVEDGGFPLMIVRKLKEVCDALANQDVNPSTTTAKATVSMSSIYHRHLLETFVTAGQLLLEKHLGELLSELIETSPTELVEGKSIISILGSTLRRKLDWKSLLISCFHLIRDCTDLSPTCEIFVFHASLLVVQVSLALTIPIENFTSSRDVSFIPPVRDADLNKHTRRDLLFSILNPNEVYEVFTVAIDKMSELSNKLEDDSMVVAVMDELKFYLTPS